MGWIQEQARQAQVVFSTCNGAFLLAKAGLLKGIEATTTAAYISDLKTAEPSVRPVYDRRFVDGGKVVTSGGLTAGIDGALHVTAKVLGRGWPEFIAANMEYEWQPSADSPHGDYGRKYLRPARGLFLGFSKPALLTEPIVSDGGDDKWAEKWGVRGGGAALELLERLNTVLASEAGWRKAEHAGRRGAVTNSRWEFTDERGRSWDGIATVEPAKGEAETLIVAVTIALRKHAVVGKPAPRRN